MMKAIYLSMLFFVSVVIQAQTIAIGGNCAYSNSSVSNNAPYTKSNNGFKMGVNLQYAFDAYFVLVSELNYEQKGSNGDINYTNTNGDITLTYNKTQYLHYATLPVLFRLQYGNKLKPFIDAGFYYGFLVNAWENPQTVGIDHTVTSNFNRSDAGVCYGAGLTYLLNKQFTLSAEWRMNNGLMDISKNGNNARNQSNIFQLSVIYTLNGLNKKVDEKK